MESKESHEEIETDKMIRTFENIINNGLSQKLLNSALNYCDKCQKSHLESALDYYLGKQDEICTTCKITYKLIQKIIKKSLETFDTSEEALIETMQNPVWERGLLSTFKGMSRFKVRKPFTPGAPYQIVWNITRACNFNCIHCYENAGQKDEDELTTQEIHETIDLLADIGVVSLAFSGGEPSIHPDILEFIKHASDRGLFVSMASNGYVFNTYEKAKQFKDAGLEFVQLSLDGLNPETHDSFRNVKGSWNRVIEAIKNFQKAGVYTGISTTVTKRNKDEIPDMIKFLNDLNVDWFMLYNFIPTGKGSNIRDIDLNPQERRELLELIYKANVDTDMNIMSTAPQFADVAVNNDTGNQMVPTHVYNVNYVNPAMKQLSEFIGGCGAGRFYMSIEPNGDIYPCVFFPHNKDVLLGNVKDKNIEDIWINHPLLKEFRSKDILKDHCGNCESKYICGGCRARAYNYFQDILSPDPGCIRNQDAWNKLETK